MNAVLRPLLGLACGILFSLALAALAGENPWFVLTVLVKSSFGSFEDFYIASYYATSLAFTGLSVALAFRAGLFNIGAEGQLAIACLCSVAFALATQNLGLFSKLPWLASFMVFVVAAVSGALWGAIPAALKIHRGAHEVIVTMMLNFVAAGLVAFFIVGPLRNLESQQPETPPVADYFRWSHLGSSDFPLNTSTLLAILVCVIAWYIFSQTRTGFEWKIVGINPSATKYNGIRSSRYIWLSMLCAGGCAGLVAINEIFGAAGKFRLGGLPEYGFTGVAVALLARNHPLAILPSALLFGALQKSAADLDIETQFINRDFAKMMQSLILLSVIVVNSDQILKLFKRRIQKGANDAAD